MPEGEEGTVLPKQAVFHQRNKKIRRLADYFPQMNMGQKVSGGVKTINGKITCLKRRTYNTKVYEDCVIPEEYHPNAPRITVDGCHLEVDGLLINEPKYHQDMGLICWQQFSNGLYHSGQIHLSADYMALTGHTVTGTHHKDASKTTFVGCMPPTEYISQIVEGSVLLPGPSVTLGYDMEHGDEFPNRILRIDGISYTFTASMDKKHTVYNIMPSPSTLEYAEIHPNTYPVSATIRLCTETLTFEGSYDKYIDNRIDESLEKENQGRNTTPLSWIGKVKDVPKRMPAIELLDNEGGAKATVDYIHPKISLMAEASPAPDESLSVMELFGIAGHPPDGVQDMAEKFLMRNMKYCMKEEWLEDFFGEQKPLIPNSDPMINIINREGAHDFYGKEFATGYLGQAFYRQTPPNVHISKDDYMKLKYYFNNGLAKSKIYTSQTGALYEEAYVYKSNQLQKYIEDQKLRQSKFYWAEQLYNVLTSSQQINIAVVRIIHHIGQDPAAEFKTFGVVLNILQPTGELASQMMEILISAVTAAMSRGINDTDQERIRGWLGDVIGQFVGDYGHHPPDPSDQKQLERRAMAQALQRASEDMGGMDAFIKELSYLYGGYKAAKNTFNKVKDLVKAFKNRNKQIQKWTKKELNSLDKALVCVSYIGGLYTMIVTFKGWGNLNPAKKAKAIADAVKLAGKLAIELPMIVEFVGKNALRLMKVIGNFFSRFDICKDIGKMFASVATVAEQWLVEIGQRMAAYFPKGASKILVKAGDVLYKLYDKLPKALEFFGPIVALAAVSVLCYNFAMALSNGAPTLDTVLLGIQAAAALMETIFSIVGMATSFGWAGPLGALCAVIGAIAVLIAALIPKKHPPSPAEKFVDNDLRKFLVDLPAPPNDWVSPD